MLILDLTVVPIVWLNITPSISPNCSGELIEHINTLIDALSRDHRRGATEIVEDIGEILMRIGEVGSEDREAGEALFRRAVKRLVKSQPTMASVLNILNRACLAREESEENWGLFQDRIAGLLKRYQNARQEMLNRWEELPPAPRALITFSNSSTAAALVVKCFEAGRVGEVFLSEARPVNEGLILARKLIAQGVKVTLFSDAALMSTVDKADAVWVGGDSLSEKGLVNKIGSKALAILARTAGIPFISLMATDKVLSPQLRPYLHNLRQNPRELVGEEIKGLNVVNEYYEEVPLDLVSEVFSEYGLRKPHQLLALVGEEPVSPLFLQLTSI